MLNNDNTYKTYPKVSVMVVTYNHEKFIGECLDSILEQNYPNLEIVVSDDASNDKTQQILKEYHLKHSNIIKLILSDKNEGITKNTNKAFLNCRGEYIALFAGDDLMLPTKIRKQVEFFENNNDYVYCYHDLEVFESDTNKVLGYFNSGRNSIQPQEGPGVKLIKYGVFSGGCSIMVRRSSCPIDGYDERIKYASDWLFFIETAINGKIKYIPEVLGRYRRHGGNITGIITDHYEQLQTLAIVEAKYPEFSKFTRNYRSRYLYGQATNRILNKKNLEGRKLLLESIRQGWVSWKWFVWFLISILNITVKKDT